LCGNPLKNGASDVLYAVATHCPEMECVDLRGCSIERLEVPLVLCHNSHVTVRLDNNPMVSPPPEVVARGWHEVRRFVALVMERGGAVKCNRVKLLLVGDGYAGKSSVAAVVKAVVRSHDQLCVDLPQPDDSGRTVGVDQCTVPMKSLSSGRELVVAMVDVAGQHVSYPTHVFFMSHRSVVALVVDISWRDADTKISRLEEAIRCVRWYIDAWMLCCGSV
jgi:hypothetical protein